MPSEDGNIIPTSIEIWGISVPTTARGRRQWPNDIKQMALHKVASGTAIAKVTREIGVNDCILRRWIKSKHAATAGEPRFIQLEVSEPPRISREFVPQAKDPTEIHAEQSDLARDAYDCALCIGSLTLKFSAKIGSERLSNIIRAIAQSQESHLGDLTTAP